MSVVIHWFRRDLRLSDNTALLAALASGAQVLPLFIVDPAIVRGPRFGLPRMAFLLDGLAALDERLREQGARLIVRRGEPLAVLREVVQESGAAALFFNRDYTPFARRRDAAICDSIGIPTHVYDDLLLHPPEAVLTDSGTPYTVFTPFKRRWLSLDKPEPAANTDMSGRFFVPGSDAPLPTLADLDLPGTIAVPEAGELAARRRLELFITTAVHDYAEHRNRLPTDPFGEAVPSTSSYLSPYLHLGMLSPRQARNAAVEAWKAAEGAAARHSVETWVSELCWREFYNHILYHFPHVDRHSFRPEFERVDFRDDPDGLRAWQEGCTGIPLIDAAMRQLQQIGWLPNRARLVVASFLCKHLLIHWREGESHFSRWLIDGDTAANNGGWQWAAGTGTDAQPYFRIFNPVSQGKQYDPEGTYVRHWVPELSEVPNSAIHAPWTLPAPPAGYPLPIVDLKAARERALAAFSAVRQYKLSVADDEE